MKSDTDRKEKVSDQIFVAGKNCNDQLHMFFHAICPNQLAQKVEFFVSDKISLSQFVQWLSHYVFGFLLFSLKKLILIRDEI